MRTPGTAATSRPSTAAGELLDLEVEEKRFQEEIEEAKLQQQGDSAGDDEIFPEFVPQGATPRGNVQPPPPPRTGRYEYGGVDDADADDAAADLGVRAADPEEVPYETSKVRACQRTMGALCGELERLQAALELAALGIEGSGGKAGGGRQFRSST